MNTIAESQLLQSCVSKYGVRKVRKWVPAASYRSLKDATITLHRERPIRPNRSHFFDTVRNVKKSVHSENTRRKSFRP